MSNDEGDVCDFTCEVEFGTGWVEDTEDDTTDALMTAKYYTGDPAGLRHFLAGPAAIMTLDSYGEEGVAQPTLAEVEELLLQRPGFMERPEVSYRDVPAGPAVRLEGPFTQRGWGGLRRQKGHVVTFVVTPPGRHQIIELTVASSDRHHGHEVSGLADTLITTLRLIPVSGQDASELPARQS
ncbi:hypothetical protein P8605_11455 [Streptomyces sp. T-3]|nr:hypothetical protein [Streptomyces sp. T-3]